MNNIRFAQKKDINKVVEIHIRAFPGFFMTKLGKNFFSD